MGHLSKIKCIESRVNVHILCSFNKCSIYTTVQVPNLALTHTKRITVWGGGWRMYLGSTSTPWPRREAAMNQKEFMMVKVFPTFSSLSMRACVHRGVISQKARMHSLAEPIFLDGIYPRYTWDISSKHQRVPQGLPLQCIIILPF
jgi:hypothetical protein